MAETILVVDDNSAVLDVCVSILKFAGFVVLSADSAPEAMAVAGAYTGRIDLLLSDVMMPGVSGPDLGIALKQTRPDLHVMLMSGFPAGELLVLNYGWAFIDKPFVAKRLVEMINVLLHTPNRSQGAWQYDMRRDSGKQE